ncbi:MAG: Carnitine monooxygenase reductase subunit [Candidatus Celerinatantimonas neptuna]|nr:MAG: Carnitine monooxygenase reductase subunit [Candidatus Celerinatantimonas neptuna]
MISVMVRNVVREAKAVIRIVLGRSDDRPLPAFEAGAHIDVHLPNGLIRQYSLCRLQADARFYEIAVLKEPLSRGGSKQVHALNEGDKLMIREPRNHFPLVSLNRKSLLIAGGIGVTPLLTMAQTLAGSGSDFEFHYSAKKPEEAAFYTALKNSSFADKMRFHFSQVSGSGRMDIRRELAKHTAKTELYLCGPTGFIDAALSEARMLGWPDHKLHREFFSAPVAENVMSANKAFTIKIASTGEELFVDADTSIVRVLEEHGVFIPVSCEEGVCGTCKTCVVDGIPEHRDVFLSDQEHREGKLIMVCCSRSKTKILTLDL